MRITCFLSSTLLSTTAAVALAAPNIAPSSADRAPRPEAKAPVEKPAAKPTEKPAATKPDAKELLQNADRARSGAASGMTWEVTLEDHDGRAPVSATYLVRSLGDDARVEVAAPPRSKGEVMLFNDRAIWFHKPGLRKPVSISARQRLSGQAANGDIATTNYARDYDGIVTGEEQVDGVAAWVLELKSKAKDTTYDQIRYWVSKDRRLGVKAEYLTLQGKPMKRASFVYGNKIKLGSESVDFVSKITIADALAPDRFSVMTYANPKPEVHAAALFNVTRLAE